MLTFSLLAVFGMLAFVACCLAFIGFVVSSLLWLVFLPIRLLLQPIFGVLGALAGLVFLPVALVTAAVVVFSALVFGAFAVLTPLVPLAIVGLVVWGLYRLFRPTPAF